MGRERGKEIRKELSKHKNVRQPALLFVEVGIILYEVWHVYMYELKKSFVV